MWHTPLIVKLELATHPGFLKYLFSGIEFGIGVSVMRTLSVRAFVNGAVAVLLPLVHGVPAVRAPEWSLSRMSYTTDWRQAVTDLAAQLRALLSVIHVEPFTCSAAVLTPTASWWND